MQRIKRNKKNNKYEAMAKRKERLEYYLKGEGWHLYRNNVPGTLDLPKPTKEGKTKVEINEEWEGDSYFMNLVKSGLARHVKELKSPEGNQMLNEQKLIVDQPERVTAKGVVEQVVVPDNKVLEKKKEKLQEQKPILSAEEKLLIEDPLAGVTILG